MDYCANARIVPTLRRCCLSRVLLLGGGLRLCSRLPCVNSGNRFHLSLRPCGYCSSACPPPGTVEPMAGISHTGLTIHELPTPPPPLARSLGAAGIRSVLVEANDPSPRPEPEPQRFHTSWCQARKVLAGGPRTLAWGSRRASPCDPDLGARACALACRSCLRDRTPLSAHRRLRAPPDAAYAPTWTSRIAHATGAVTMPREHA